MKKARAPIPEDTAAKVLVASDHTCCKCEERGQPVQIHHIDDNPANNDPSNLVVLCLRCHDETQIRGGFARRLSVADVRLYRDNWLSRVDKRRRDADALVVARRTGGMARERSGPHKGKLSDSEVATYIDSLPMVFSQACDQVRSNWNSGPTIDQVRAAYDLTEVLRHMWLRLATVFPEGHFEGLTPEQYAQEYLEHRYRWHRAMAEPLGYGTSGTIVGILVSRGVLRDMERALIDTRNALKGLAEKVRDSDEWMKRWNDAKKEFRPSP